MLIVVGIVMVVVMVVAFIKFSSFWHAVDNSSMIVTEGSVVLAGRSVEAYDEDVVAQSAIVDDHE